MNVLRAMATSALLASAVMPASASSSDLWTAVAYGSCLDPVLVGAPSEYPTADALGLSSFHRWFRGDGENVSWLDVTDHVTLGIRDAGKMRDPARVNVLDGCFASFRPIAASGSAAAETELDEVQRQFEAWVAPLIAAGELMETDCSCRTSLGRVGTFRREAVVPGATYFAISFHRFYDSGDGSVLDGASVSAGNLTANARTCRPVRAADACAPKEAS